ncbi:N-acetylmuramoyl-L-alanine amidase [Paenibacillus melissococcoides]|uniref:N-acetylmuramoyl-L-alanine amidase n=1 Tax=Paenibacillus melissococcoides TaxID=2912268 RepID=A0ABM9FXC5_9BACL|nr:MULTISPECIES: N-acetylmuramoyl-L-alanine amidase [Paenibacillus]MEB9894116.1 N-acetylmuramoyl-L-alanine amidase [Bacillus cereus]CAH8243647.1 N-acetylmuramoyl-L-alanine amidase [Paenibacillus melissococcoides]CAH8705005.1 N-acetylmuramoyl-L-alanine amidase [Paenibacillus melissococcoides]CAH8707778.1 N-acetylmuramoyl-L-alanine amidase [Paenibacillus melissococcoides]GIO77451.1 hypothetical protein J6TS7_10610 [Paenibacillus dendritiformis]
MTIEIKQRLLPDGRPNKPSRQMKPQYITIHNTDNLTGTAESHSRYILNGSGGREASWHYTVDDREIYQHLRDNEQGWHAGDGSGAGNASSIGIEVCMYLGMNTEQCWENAAWLVARLLDKHNLDVSRVVPHQKWSGKKCPSQLLPYWDRFLTMVKQELRKLQQPADKAVIEINGKKVAEGPNINGSVFAPVRAVGEALGCLVGWEQKTKTATINGMPVPGELIGGSAYAHVRAVAEAAGCKVKWDAKNRKVSIDK